MKNVQNTPTMVETNELLGLCDKRLLGFDVGYTGVSILPAAAPPCPYFELLVFKHAPREYRTDHICSLVIHAHDDHFYLQSALNSVSHVATHPTSATLLDRIVDLKCAGDTYFNTMACTLLSRMLADARDGNYNGDRMNLWGLARLEVYAEAQRRQSTFKWEY